MLCSQNPQLGVLACELPFGMTTTRRRLLLFDIDDTPKDIACARACGANAIAVATGGFSYEALAEYQPDHLFEDFRDHSPFLEALEL